MSKKQQPEKWEKELEKTMLFTKANCWLECSDYEGTIIEIKDFIRRLLATEKQKAIKEYANEVIPKLTKKWRGYVEKEKQKIINEFIKGRRCLNCGQFKEADLSELCDKCFEEL